MSGGNQVLHGDCLEELRKLEANSVDALVCDPPAGISFMNKSWDAHKGGRDIWIAWLAAIMREALRVLKPGAHGLIWALPRTSHWTAMALEDAGFEVRDKIFHLFGSGFPKSLDVSKAIDRMAGKEREVIGRQKAMGNARGKGAAGHYANGIASMTEGQYEVVKDGWDITAPATPDSQKWSGFGSALKPACEEWILVRKPLAEKSIAAQVLATGTGAINIDISRISGNWTTWKRKDGTIAPKEGYSSPLHMNRDAGKLEAVARNPEHPQGRFPSHLLLSHSLLCVPLGEKRVKGTAPRGKPSLGEPTNRMFGDNHPSELIHYADDEGCETVEAWQCAEQCPVRLLDEQSGVRKSTQQIKARAGTAKFNGKYNNGETYINSIDQVGGYNDQGGASRYFQTFPPFIYAPKSSRKERNAGCEALPVQANRINAPRTSEGENFSPSTNHHPTVKSQQLMQYLCKMITPPNGIVLDMFAGSGSTGVACVQSGFRYILIEKEQEYIDIIHARLAHAHKAMPVQEAGEYECVPECPVRILGEQSGVRKSDYARPKKDTAKAGMFGIIGKYKEGVDIEGYGYPGETGTAARFFQTFPPDSLFAGMDEVSGEQESGQDGEVVT